MNTPIVCEAAGLIVMCLVLVTVLAWLAYRLRFRRIIVRLDRQCEDRLAERTRIAQELHDTLLQGFVSASIQLHVIAESLPQDSPVKPRLLKVLELIRTVNDEGREALYGLRTPDIDQEDLSKALSQVQSGNGVQSWTEFRVITEGQARKLRPIVHNQVYRIFREALVNAFRHARAARIEVVIDYFDRRLRVACRDNGCGIESRVLASGCEGHFGLRGMRERAEEIGAKITLRSRPGSGTEVELMIPAHIAYSSDRPSLRTQELIRLLSWN